MHAALNSEQTKADKVLGMYTVQLKIISVILMVFNFRYSIFHIYPLIGKIHLLLHQLLFSVTC